VKGDPPCRNIAIPIGVGATVQKVVIGRGWVVQRAKHPTVGRLANPTGQGSGLNGLKVGLAVAVVCMPGG